MTQTKQPRHTGGPRSASGEHSRHGGSPTTREGYDQRPWTNRRYTFQAHDETWNTPASGETLAAIWERWRATAMQPHVQVSVRFGEAMWTMRIQRGDPMATRALRAAELAVIEICEEYHLGRIEMIPMTTRDGVALEATRAVILPRMALRLEGPGPDTGRVLAFYDGGSYGDYRRDDAWVARHLEANDALALVMTLEHGDDAIVAHTCR